MEAKRNEIIMKLLREILPYDEINQTTELIESGILDSLSIMVFVTHLEDEFQIEISDDAITADNFSNVLKIAQLVEECN